MENREPKRSLNYLIPIVMAVMMAFGLYLGRSFSPLQSVELSKGQANYQKIKDIVEILDQQYVDEVAWCTGYTITRLITANTMLQWLERMQQVALQAYKNTLSRGLNDERIILVC